MSQREHFISTSSDSWQFSVKGKKICAVNSSTGEKKYSLLLMDKGGYILYPLRVLLRKKDSLKIDSN